MRQVVFVGDSGIPNKKNIGMIEELGGKYIVDARIKWLSKEVKARYRRKKLTRRWWAKMGKGVG